MWGSIDLNDIFYREDNLAPLVVMMCGVAGSGVASYEGPEIGYKSVEEALQECETLHHKELKLPYKLPPIAFTHHFDRRTNDTEYHKNDELGIE